MNYHELELWGIVILSFSMAGIFAVAVYVILRVQPPYGLFKYDPDLPYLRQCRRCGQFQQMYEWTPRKGGYWEIQNGADPDCECHNHVRD